MAPRLAHDVMYSRKCAANVRVLAATTQDANIKDTANRLANDYERLADWVDLRAQKKTEKSPLRMTTADYQKHAKHCRELAIHMPNIEDTRQLEEMAAEWDCMASDPP
jgi:hypothetical protein